MPLKTQLRTFTLLELMASIETALNGNAQKSPSIAGDNSSSLSLPPATHAPSLPTLKNWSRTGVFKGAVTLSAATRLALAHMKTNARYYREPKSRDPLSKSGAEQSHNARAASERHAAEQDMQAQILCEVRELSQRMGKIEQQLMSSSPKPDAVVATILAQVPGQDTPASDALSRRLLSAIDQLDATRRHLMLRFDSEIQLTKQAGQGRGADAVSPMDIQRILVRLSNIEQLLKTTG